ncbi:YpiF family protein [Solibacillus sp. CAU 1738]|uniref:YpiF family protein n=1 Tax=Solibacillus sp. CAU 1738 TaxID=3140363 RepID=UPI00325FF931
MFFNVKDVELFQAQKQFIDTAIVPLLSLDFEENSMKQSSSAAEYLMSLTAFIEQQFKGRLMLTPPFSYIEQTRHQIDITIIKEILTKSGFKHVIFISCDHFWTSLQDDLNIIWLPPIPLESMDKSVKQRILEDQLKQVIPNLTAAWSKQ